MTDEREKTESIGNIKMSEEVIAIVAGVAATSVAGVKEMSNTITGGIAERLGKKSFSKGVKVEIDENETKISLALAVEYGCKIPEVAWEVQEKVKKAVETMTGLEVLEVNIFVDGLIMAKEEKAAESEKE